MKGGYRWGRIWIKNEDAVIRRGYALGISTSSIAAELNLTRNQIIGRANRLDLKHKFPSGLKRTPKQDAIIRAGYVDGTPRYKIARATGLTGRQVTSRASELGLRRRQFEARP